MLVCIRKENCCSFFFLHIAVFMSVIHYHVDHATPLCYRGPSGQYIDTGPETDVECYVESVGSVG